MEACRLGLASSEQEYDDLIACVTKEWDNGQEASASAELTAMYAQKVWSLFQEAILLN